MNIHTSTDIAGLSGITGVCVQDAGSFSLVGADNLPGLTGATADGGTWQVSRGTLQVTPPSPPRLVIP